jgi:hypothetical protein
LERKWRFLEAGRTRKRFWGEPFPVRHLETTVVAGGQAVTGHLYTVPLYVESTNGTSKVLLKAKQRGREGQTLTDLVYPARIVLADGPTRHVIAGTTLVFPVAVAASVSGVVALAVPDLARYPARPASTTNGVWRLPPIYGGNAFVAAQAGNTLYVGWPPGDDADLRAELTAAMANVRDFFDRHTILAACTPVDEDVVFSLMRMEREAGVVGRRPWRIGVWRWRRNEDGALLLAGRGFLVRGPMTRAPPAVELSGDAWEWDFARGGQRAGDVLVRGKGAAADD